KRAMREGAFGFSTGLGYVHSRETPYAEIKMLAEIATSFHGVYSTHLRKSGPGVEDSVKETIKIFEETGVKTIVSHFLPLKGSEAEYGSALSLVENLPADADFHFDIYPFETTVLPLYTFLPLWVQNGGAEVMRSNISDKWLQPRIVKDFPEVEPNDIKVAQASGNAALVGKSLGDIMDMYSLVAPREALLKLMLVTKLKASVFYKNVNSALVRKGLSSPRSFISSNAASIGKNRSMERIERSSATFTKFLSLVEREGLMPLDEAIRKITAAPARTFNLMGRGEVKEGNFADLTGFKDGEIKFTVVNGSVAFQNGECTGARAGKPLRHYGN
ncbi:MAG: amidohydrolase family protein, partial [Patescibacteria group bacterium]